jgi:tRNA G18 (ribose-2'-O)-methylase SpoU
MDEFALARRALRGATTDLLIIDDERNIRAALDAGVDVLRVYDNLSKQQRTALFPDTRAPDVFAVARLPRAPTNKAIAARGGDLLVLDGVRGPGNIGAIVRTAVAFDITAVIALNAKRRDLFRRAAIRAAGPAMFKMALQTMTTEQLVALCRRNDISIVTTSPRSGAAACPAGERLAIVLGSEAAGCSADVESAAACSIGIPISTAVESLNVSAAAAVLAHQRAAQRRRSRHSSKSDKED